MADAAAEQNVTYAVAEGVASIGFNRPEKKNALTVAMYRALVEALTKAEADPQIGALLLHGSDRCFTAGNDLQDFLNASAALSDEASPTVQFLKLVSTLRKPLVAAVAGPAIGIGTTVLLHCDLVYADGTARFQLPFVNLGLCPEAASSVLLPQLVGHQRAAELLLLGEPFAAEAARAMGLVNEITGEGEAISRAAAVAKRIAKQPLGSLLLTKSLMKRQQAPAIAETLDIELKHFHERLSSPEAKAAMQAFFERRPRA